MTPLRIVAVRYLNTAPLIEGLGKVRGLELRTAAPAAIGALVAKGDADVGLASVIDAITIHPALAMIPAGMIGCDGPTRTVRVFSRVPFAEVRRLHADSESHTSIALARVILARCFGATPEVEEFPACEIGRGGRLPDTILLIGDKVVTAAPPADDYPYRLDLGEEWKALTGLPFVYAIWMCRAELTDDPRISAAAGLLDRQRRRNAARLDWIVSRSAPAHGWNVPEAAQYLGSLLRYTVGEREREGIARFFAECAELNIAPARDARWAEVLACAV